MTPSPSIRKLNPSSGALGRPMKPGSIVGTNIRSRPGPMNMQLAGILVGNFTSRITSPSGEAQHHPAFADCGPDIAVGVHCRPVGDRAVAGTVEERAAVRRGARLDVVVIGIDQVAQAVGVVEHRVIGRPARSVAEVDIVIELGELAVDAERP